MALHASEVASWAPAYQRALQSIQSLQQLNIPGTLKAITAQMNTTRPPATPEFTGDTVEHVLRLLSSSGHIRVCSDSREACYLPTPSAPIVTEVRNYDMRRGADARSMTNGSRSPHRSTLQGAEGFTPSSQQNTRVTQDRESAGEVASGQKSASRADASDSSSAVPNNRLPKAIRRTATNLELSGQAAQSHSEGSSAAKRSSTLGTNGTVSDGPREPPMSTAAGTNVPGGEPPASTSCEVDVDESRCEGPEDQPPQRRATNKPKASKSGARSSPEAASQACAQPSSAGKNADRVADIAERVIRARGPSDWFTGDEFTLPEGLSSGRFKMACSTLAKAGKLERTNRWVGSQCFYVFRLPQNGESKSDVP